MLAMGDSTLRSDEKRIESARRKRELRRMTERSKACPPPWKRRGSNPLPFGPGDSIPTTCCIPRTKMKHLLAETEAMATMA
jgi:hypothetical protein